MFINPLIATEEEMSRVAEVRVEEEMEAEMVSLCDELLREWSQELSFEEKQIWLWNALVEMVKIKQRRKS